MLDGAANISTTSWCENPAQLRRPWGPVLRVLRYPTALLRDWLAGDIDIQAMSLAYTTLLSLVPLMVFSFCDPEAPRRALRLEIHPARVLPPLGQCGRSS